MYIVLKTLSENTYFYIEKQPSRGVLSKRCSENMLQIYRKTPMPKCDFNKVAKQLYWNHTSAWVFSCKFAAYFQNTYHILYISKFITSCTFLLAFKIIESLHRIISTNLTKWSNTLKKFVGFCQRWRVGT